MSRNPRNADKDGEIGETVNSVGYIGNVGMNQTDKEIIKMMLE